MQSLQNIGYWLNQKITTIFGRSQNQSNKITYNDSNFNSRKKLQTTEQDQKNEVIADLKSKLQALQECKSDDQTGQIV